MADDDAGNLTARASSGPGAVAGRAAGWRPAPASPTSARAAWLAGVASRSGELNIVTARWLASPRQKTLRRVLVRSNETSLTSGMIVG